MKNEELKADATGWAGFRIPRSAFGI